MSDNTFVNEPSDNDPLVACTRLTTSSGWYFHYALQYWLLSVLQCTLQFDGIISMLTGSQ